MVSVLETPWLRLLQTYPVSARSPPTALRDRPLRRRVVGRIVTDGDCIAAPGIDGRASRTVGEAGGGYGADSLVQLFPGQDELAVVPENLHSTVTAIAQGEPCGVFNVPARLLELQGTSLETVAELSTSTGLDMVSTRSVGKVGTKSQRTFGFSWPLHSNWNEDCRAAITPA